MEKKILGALLLILLLFGSSGCTRPQASPTPQATPIPQTQSTMITPSNDTYQAELLNNPPKPLNASENQAVPILYYHSVMQENGNELRMPPKEFDNQMAYLKNKGFQSISLDQLYQATYNGGALPIKPFVITFDDGYLDNYTTAFPILAKYEFTATVFMVTSYINGEGYMSWHQLKELVANGWEIEGHTTSHPYLTRINYSTLLSELNSSKELLEKELGRPANFFAYPYGDLNDNVVQSLKNTGYMMAVTTERGWADVKADAWRVQRIYCFASMGMNEFTRRMQNPKY
ncbi:polysaccharide deacetylase family protein [Desulfosporosinus fructosivorans]|uniref:Polysaccharide deacetylase family protein n=1 Tax=Desulfosporosinus fructosivorans TaxID=2018669 RepID=A0A4Z0R672_9FIRM|nr:polysaccharide deacetylase family protein [Desulfosporosinus fructosivorans]TGE37875.1 polysaccharide deacetylase family protein [Desulfosporosinus fructosivorans]